MKTGKGSVWATHYTASSNNTHMDKHTHTCAHKHMHTHIHTHMCAHKDTHMCSHKERYTHRDKTDPDRDADKAPSESRCRPPHLNVLVLVEGATGAEELAELTARHQGHQQVGSSWGQHQSTSSPTTLIMQHRTSFLHTLYDPSHTHSPLICTPCTIPLTPIHPLSHTLYDPTYILYNHSQTPVRLEKRHSANSS